MKFLKNKDTNLREQGRKIDHAGVGEDEPDQNLLCKSNFLKKKLRNTLKNF